MFLHRSSGSIIFKRRTSTVTIMIALIIVPFFAMFVAFVSNMAGIGGGALLALFFIYAIGLSSFSSSGLSLITIATSSLIGSYSNIRNGFVNFNLFKLLLATGLVGVLFGSLLSFLVPTEEFKQIFGFIPLTIGLFSLYFAINQRKFRKYIKPEKKFSSDIGFIGVIAGIISGFTGMGIGGITGTYLIAVKKMHPKTIFSTIILAMIVTSVFGGLLHIGAIRFQESTLIYMPLLVFGAVVGAFIGARVSSLTKSRDLRILQSVVILSTGILAISIYFFIS